MGETDQMALIITSGWGLSREAATEHLEQWLGNTNHPLGSGPDDLRLDRTSSHPEFCVAYFSPGWLVNRRDPTSGQKTDQLST